jgi:nifR3 family TIM-barrel protein
MIALHNRALLAPMSGITDQPFRRLAHRLGAGLVVAEMAAEKLINSSHRETLMRIAPSPGIRPHVVQIMGRDPGQMAEAARVAADCGADMVDINMGCPARKVVSGLAGSALMREPALALAIIDAVVAAVEVPVSLKMRLGWDHSSRNAPDIARSAAQAGIAMLFVHGRTRCQFYDGAADWFAIGDVVSAVGVPVYANGDIRRLCDVDACLGQSGAAGIMIGRGALGRPWFVGQAARYIENAAATGEPSSAQQHDLVIEHYDDMLLHYGRELGVRVARKHLGWYIDDLFADHAERATWRAMLLRDSDPKRVTARIDDMFDAAGNGYRLAS